MTSVATVATDFVTELISCHLVPDCRSKVFLKAGGQPMVTFVLMIVNIYCSLHFIHNAVYIWFSHNKQDEITLHGKSDKCQRRNV